MPHDIARHARVLIGQVQTRYHDAHRRALSGLLDMASALADRGIDEGLGEELHRIRDALERHMFKEEMRLFPMMEQGGNTLIGRLIEDLQREHAAHAEAMLGLRDRLSALAARHGAEPALATLVCAVEGLAHELEQHIRTEDEELFAMFVHSERSGRRDASRSLSST